MITRNEAILLLSELENKGINVDKQLQEVMTRGLSKELLVFLNDHRPLDIHNFYEKLRKNYNKKKAAKIAIGVAAGVLGAAGIAAAVTSCNKNTNKNN